MIDEWTTVNCRTKRSNLLIDIFSAHYIFLGISTFRGERSRRQRGREVEEEELRNLIDYRGGGRLAESRDCACVPLVKHVYSEGCEKDEGGGGGGSSLKSNKSREQISRRRKTSFHHGGYISDIFFPPDRGGSSCAIFSDGRRNQPCLSRDFPR